MHTLAEFLKMWRAVRKYTCNIIKAHLQSNFYRDWMNNRRVISDFQKWKVWFLGLPTEKNSLEGITWKLVEDGATNAVQNICCLK